MVNGTHPSKQDQKRVTAQLVLFFSITANRDDDEKHHSVPHGKVRRIEISFDKNVPGPVTAVGKLKYYNA